MAKEKKEEQFTDEQMQADAAVNPPIEIRAGLTLAQVAEYWQSGRTRDEAQDYQMQFTHRCQSLGDGINFCGVSDEYPERCTNPVLTVPTAEAVVWVCADCDALTRNK